MVGYADIPGDRTPEINWLRANPHRLHLGRIGFRLTRADGSAAAPSDLTEVRQTLDLWNGVIVSHFRFDGEPVDVETVCHPTIDAVGVRVRSPLVGTGRVAIEFRFPYGTGQTTAADWTKPDAHRTVLARSRIRTKPASRGRSTPTRTTSRSAGCPAGRWPTPARTRTCCRRRPGRRRSRSRRCSRRSRPAERPPGFDDTAPRRARTGTGSGPPAAPSTSRAAPIPAGANSSAASCCRSTSRPSSARAATRRRRRASRSTAGKASSTSRCTGGTRRTSRCGTACRCSSAASATTTPSCRRREATAARQGYAGARWPKMTSPTGDESPSSVGPFLVWQQPHPIFYAELVYRAAPRPRDARALPRRRVRDRRVHGVVPGVGRAGADASCSARR